MKKILSILLAVTMLATSLVFSSTAMAESKNVCVSYSVFDGGMFTMMPTEIEVSADLSDKYAEVIGYNDTLDVPTVLDATIQAHIEMFGEDFMDYAPLDLTSAGWINGAFGEATNAVGYWNNGVSCMSFDEALTENGYVEFVFYGDTSYWSDTYNYFDSRNKDVLIGKPVTLTMTANSWGYDSPADEVTVYVNDEPYGMTDEDGKIELTFDNVGKYIVTAYPDYEEDEFFFAPYCEINVDTKLSRYISKEMNGAKEYLIKDTDIIEVNKATDFLTYLKAGKLTPSQKAKFVQSVKENLKKNDGKIVVDNSENIGIYGATITALTMLGYSPNNFYEFDIVKAFESIDLDLYCNPYNYRFAVEAADLDYKKDICDYYVAKFYKNGIGADFWGGWYSCDDNGYFIATLSQCKNEYADIINDTLNAISAYKVSNGTYSFSSTDLSAGNADSTAAVLMAYASISDADNAFTTYKNLVEKFEDKTGVFVGSFDSGVSTKNSLIALEYYNEFVSANNIEHKVKVGKTTTVKATCTQDGSKTKICSICGSKSVTVLPATGHNYVEKVIRYNRCDKADLEVRTCKNCGLKQEAPLTAIKKHVMTSKLTKKPTASSTGVITCSCKYCSYKYTKTVAKLGKTELTKVNPIKAGFKVNWKKQSSATGYQIKYSSSKDFAHYKVITISSNSTTSKTISKLKSNKKYYVRVRTYKTINGVKCYTGWSKYMAVKTK